MGVWDTVAGAADHVAGSTDEAVGRSFDQEAGGGVWDGATGAADHLAGSTDESIGRQFDDTVGGGLFDGTTSGNPVSEDTDGDGDPDAYYNRWLRGEHVRSLYDTVFEYDGTLNGRQDSSDLAGPGAWGSEGSVWDTVHTTPDEEPSGAERSTRWLIYGALAAVALYLLAPVLQLGAAAAEAAGGD